MCLIIVIVGPAILYLLTLAPTILWEESAGWTLSVQQQEIDFFKSAAHGLHTILGILFSQIPFISSDLAYSQNFMSAFFGWLALLMLYAILFKLTGLPIAALIGTISLAVSQLFWHLSVITEVYSLFAFFTFLQIYILLSWRQSQRFYWLGLLGLALVGGLLVHTMTILFIPFFAIWVYYWSRQKKLVLILLSIIMLSGFIFFIFTTPGQNIGHHFITRTKLVFNNYIIPAQLPTQLLLYPFYLFYQFPLIGLFIGVLGILNCWKKDRSLLVFLSSLFISNIMLSSISYLRRAPYHALISYLVWAIMVGYGWPFVQEYFKNKRRSIIILIGLIILLPFLLYYLIPRWANQFNIELTPLARRIPAGSTNTYYLRPAKRHYTQTAQFVQEIIANLPTEPGIIFTEINVSAPLQYYINKGEKISPQLVLPDDLFGEPKVVIWQRIQALIESNLQRGRKAYLTNEKNFVVITQKKEYFNIVPLIKNEYQLTRHGNYLWEITFK